VKKKKGGQGDETNPILNMLLSSQDDSESSLFASGVVSTHRNNELLGQDDEEENEGEDILPSFATGLVTKELATSVVKYHIGEDDARARRSSPKKRDRNFGALFFK